MVKSDMNDKPQASSHCTSMRRTRLVHSYTVNSAVVYHSLLIGNTCDPAWAHFSKVLKIFGRMGHQGPISQKYCKICRPEKPFVKLQPA